MGVYETFRDLTSKIVDKMGLPDEVMDTIVETTELKSKSELIDETNKNIKNNLVNYNPTDMTEEDNKRFIGFMKKYEEKSIDSKCIGVFAPHVKQQIKKSEGKRQKALEAILNLSKNLMEIYDIGDIGAAYTNEGVIIYPEDGRIKSRLSSEIGHAISELGKNKVISSVSEVYDYAAREAAGVPYLEKTIEANALLGRITMEDITEDEKKSIIEKSSLDDIKDYERYINESGHPAHQEAAWIFKKLKDEYGKDKTLKALGKALYNPRVSLDNPLDFYDSVRFQERTI